MQFDVQNFIMQVQLDFQLLNKQISTLEYMNIYELNMLKFLVIKRKQINSYQHVNMKIKYKSRFIAYFHVFFLSYENSRNFVTQIVIGDRNCIQLNPRVILQTQEEIN